MLTLTDHWLDQAARIDSPNFNPRPDDCQPSLIVIHNISLPPGVFGGPAIDQLFTNTLSPDEHPYFRQIAHLRVSSHFLIRRDGDITQYVACDHRAWHAGQSCWREKTNCNDFSIGIELEGTDDIAYTDSQYGVLVQLIMALRRQYPLIAENALTGHEHIAPGRKTDPGPAFDWQHLMEQLKQADV